MMQKNRLYASNGEGVPEEKLVKIQQQLSFIHDSGEQIGLYNTHRRLVLLFGEGYGVTLKSRYGEGTTVEVRKPFRKGENLSVQGLDH